MAKKKNSEDTIKIRRGSQERTIPKSQWDAMKKNNATYDWLPASEVPKDVKTKEEQVEHNQIQELNKKLEASEAEKADLQKSVEEKDKAIEAKDSEIAELNKKLEASESKAKDTKKK